MFTNSTFLSLYAQARRDEDLRPRHATAQRAFLAVPRSFLPSVRRRSAPSRPVPATASR